MKYQKTIKNSIGLSGLGLHNGETVNMTLSAAPENTGIVFIRSDLNHQKLKVSPNVVHESLLCTCLQEGDMKVSTIEHLMSALAAMEIDNLYITLDSAEVPVMDGSAEPFVFAIQSAGTISQSQPRKSTYVTQTVSVSDNESYAEFTSALEGLHLHLTIDFPHPVIASTAQEVDFTLSSIAFIKEVCRARTFGMASDLDKLNAKGLALGASLENAIGVGDKKILNPGGLRYPDEFVRHKLLDAIGDLYMMGPIIGKFKAYKTSHRLNNMLLVKLLNTPSAYETRAG